MRITRVYTGGGDEGDTGLGGGQRVSKDALRIEACGTVDELNSLIGLAIARGLAVEVDEDLRTVQNDLFDLGADLAVLQEDKPGTGACGIESGHVTRLEVKIDALGEKLGPLEEFILPGGSVGAATLHLARTVCRRAERVVVSLSKEEPVGGQVIAYLNRLSDLLFMLARMQNRSAGRGETAWEKKSGGGSSPSPGDQ